MDFYIYYEPDGTIVSLTPVKEDIGLPYVVVDEPAGRIFLNGDCSIREYYVDLSLALGFPLVKRILTQIPTIKDAEFIELFANEKSNSELVVYGDCVEVTVDSKASKVLSLIKEAADYRIGFAVYLTGKNAPDEYIEELVIDPNDLLSQKSVVCQRVYHDTNVSVFSNHILQQFNLVLKDENKNS